MTHQEAIGLFKEVKKGPVVVTIGRRTSTASVTASNLSIKTLNTNISVSGNFPSTNEAEEWRRRRKNKINKKDFQRRKKSKFEAFLRKKNLRIFCVGTKERYSRTVLIDSSMQTFSSN